MGFLKFFKKEKKEAKKEEFEVPPPPSLYPGEEFPVSAELPEFPAIKPKPAEKKAEEKISPAPLVTPVIEEKPKVSLEYPHKLPNLEEKPAQEKKVPKERFGTEPYYEKSYIYEPKETGVSLKERKMDVTKPIFVRAESYKEILDEIGLARNQLKEAEDILIGLDDVQDDKNKKFTKWHSILEDAQRKLIFVDKTLFEK